MGIHVVERRSPEGQAVYYLQHDFDTDIFSDLTGDGPFSSRAEADSAAERLEAAIACVN
jgi:hypothetical protein